MSWRPFRRPSVFTAVHEPLLGTSVEIAIESSDRSTAEKAADRLVREMRRLEATFSVFDPESELRRWREGRLDQPPSAELSALLGIAAVWVGRTGGAFSPVAGELRRLWLLAEEEGSPPEAEELQNAATRQDKLPYVAHDGTVERISSCDAVDLNAIAKGRIVDLGVRSVLADDSTNSLDRIVVNAGGDVVHWGSGHLRVGIENPLRPYDNEPPLTALNISGEGLATSGDARRWFNVGGVRYSRVLDPRTGQPARHVASASVLAPDAMTADIVATAATVLAPEETLRLVDGLEAVECLLISPNGDAIRSDGWARRERATQRG